MATFPPLKDRNTDTQVIFIAGDADPECKEPFAEFSNFFPCKFELDGGVWRSTEHYFQSRKYDSRPDYQEKIMNAELPRDAVELGRDRTVPMRADWENVKISFMEKAQEAKFTQNAELMQVLQSTGSKKIVMFHPRDKFWGNGGDDSGTNKMGQILMQVRDKSRL